MQTFNITMVLTRKQNDSEFDNVSKVKSEITSWLEDLDFTVEFDTETYDEKAKDILWEYVSYSDIPEITKRLEEIE
tara:strand:- start:304 stop:531 length:228 start_codon:yes stop_codon:yes gene_type:complete